MKKLINLFSMVVLTVTMAACSLPGSAIAASSTQPQEQVASAPESDGETANVTGTIVAVTDIAAQMSTTHDDDIDYSWDESSVVSISLNGNSISAEGDGAIVDGSRVTINAPGTYSLSGSLDDGQVIVSTKDDGVVRLILNGVNIQNSTTSPIFVEEAEKVLIILEESTQNTISDSLNYVFANPEDEVPNAAVFSSSDLTITGSGSLTVSGNYNDGISSNDGLIIDSGSVTVNAVDDGIRGMDYLVVKEGSIKITAGGDGLKADNEEDITKGYISVLSGNIQIESAGDAIAAATNVLINDGEFAVVSGGGSTVQVDETTSVKGIKSGANIIIENGVFSVDSADDAFHSGGSLVINAGTINIATGDDALHADGNIELNDGTIQISRSYEGIESALITINGGDIHVVASDDGINVATGNDGSGMMQPGGRSEQEAFTYTGSNYLYVNGGTISVDAGGDGVDANGAIVMTGGVLLVNGPTENMNAAMDFDSGFNLTGGTLVAAGSAGMVQAPGSYSTQNSVLVYLEATQPAGTLINIQNSTGEDILTFAPAKAFQSLVFSSSQLVSGETYTISLGGNSTGTNANGLFSGGEYEPGTKLADFSVSSVISTVGTGGGSFGGRGTGPRQP